MSMDESRTCGKGLAERSALPARLSALTAAMADVLEKHQQTLDLTDDNARAEHTAYQQLASDYRNLASQLRATADRMAGYRDLPMARHHAARHGRIRNPRSSGQPRGTRARCCGAPRNVDRRGPADAGMLKGVIMSTLQAESLLLTRVPITETGMLIRKPVADVFEAIVNPEITTQFWFTSSSGRLAVGQPIRWDWEMYNVSDPGHRHGNRTQPPNRHRVAGIQRAHDS